MQRKALKQLGKVTQWTNEKVFSGEKTQLSNEFTQFEKEVDVKRKGIERLHATSTTFFEQVTKVKATSDPYPSGSSKDKIFPTEALGLVMIDYGGDLRDSYGDALSKFGRARCKLATAQQEFGNRLSEGYMGGMEQSLEAVNEYKTFRKKLDSRRLALDAAVYKMNNSKKDTRVLEQEVDLARERFEEVEEETAARMEFIQGGEEQQFMELTDLLDAELEYFVKCKEILEELRESWPSAPSGNSSSGRPRAKSNASARSTTSRHAPKSYNVSSDDEATANRSRSQSNASSTGRGKEKRSILPSFGLGKKSGLSGMVAKRKNVQRYGSGDDVRAALASDDEDEEEAYTPPRSPRNQFAANGRTRSGSTLSTSVYNADSEFTTGHAAPTLRRTYTSPPTLGSRYVKALYDFPGDNHDELQMFTGMIIEVKSEISEDWWIGESNGETGMFPSKYTEEHIPSPTTPSLPPPMPKRSMPPMGTTPGGSRALPPLSTSSLAPPAAKNPNNLPPSPTLEYHLTSDSEMSHGGYDDPEDFASAGLTSMAQPTPTASSVPQTRSRSNTATKKPPPPPPSRRVNSSNNILTPTIASNAPANRSRAGTLSSRSISNQGSPQGSPFVGSPFAASGDELDSDSGGALNMSRGSSSGLSADRNKANGGVGGLNSGLGAMHLRKNGNVNVGDCGDCGCVDFTQNVFKPSGVCSTCFHQHPNA